MLFDLPHGDNPSCVAPALRSLKIKLNDSNWSNDQARTKGLRRLGLAQLGSAGILDEKEFVSHVVKLSITKQIPIALRAAASICKNIDYKNALLNAANKCEKEGTRRSALEAKNTAADAAYAADAKAIARDKVLSEFAEDVVGILIDMKAPGCQWLYLTEE